MAYPSPHIASLERLGNSKKGACGQGDRGFIELKNDDHACMLVFYLDYINDIAFSDADADHNICAKRTVRIYVPFHAEDFL
jgi:hypothetical protein